MTSRDVNKLINEGEKGVEKLYSLHMKYFDLVDTHADILTNGDLLDENEIAICMEQLTGCLMKLGTVAGALEALLAEKEHGEEVKGYASYEKLKAHDVSVVKANARDSIGKIRKWANDFRSYFYSAQSGVITAQSRLKRLTVQKGAKGIDKTGETPLDDGSSTGDPRPQPDTLTNDTTGSPPTEFSTPDGTTPPTDLQEPEKIGEDNEW